MCLRSAPESEKACGGGKGVRGGERGARGELARGAGPAHVPHGGGEHPGRATTRVHCRARARSSAGRQAGQWPSDPHLAAARYRADKVSVGARAVTRAGTEGGLLVGHPLVHGHLARERALHDDLHLPLARALLRLEGGGAGGEANNPIAAVSPSARALVVAVQLGGEAEKRRYRSSTIVLLLCRSRLLALAPGSGRYRCRGRCVGATWRSAAAGFLELRAVAVGPHVSHHAARAARHAHLLGGEGVGHVDGVISTLGAIA
mmetsp:Transcript_11417/g.33867  ORF Transcript_11417/g.33867 Transcript_11417/m.33867 type:complete len:261 (-) Transcript_11417:173-955(-)